MLLQIIGLVIAFYFLYELVKFLRGASIANHIINISPDFPDDESTLSDRIDILRNRE